MRTIRDYFRLKSIILTFISFSKILKFNLYSILHIVLYNKRITQNCHYLCSKEIISKVCKKFDKIMLIISEHSEIRKV